MASMGEGPLSCSECGAELRGAGQVLLGVRGAGGATGSDHELRKTVTLLFTDVTGSTALGEQLDPEAYRGVMGRYFAVARAAVERHGGTVEKFVGDAVLAVFGVPEVREDDACARCGPPRRCGRRSPSCRGELRAELGVRLEIRTGVNTGRSWPGRRGRAARSRPATR